MNNTNKLSGSIHKINPPACWLAIWLFWLDPNDRSGGCARRSAPLSKRSRIPLASRFLLHFKELLKQRGLFQVGLLADFALGLQALKQFDGALEVALDAGGVAGDAIDLLRVHGIGGELVRVGAMEAPLGVGDGLNDVHLRGAAGVAIPASNSGNAPGKPACPHEA